MLLLIAKVLIENFSDLGSSTAEYIDIRIDIRVVTEVHLIGALMGVFVALLPKRMLCRDC